MRDAFADLPLAGAHALVTGGGTGIGAAIARALAAAGARLTLVGRRREPLDALTADLPGTACVSADLTDPKASAHVLAAANAANGPLTLLINNAGAAESAAFARTDDALWSRMMAINLDAPFRLTRAALPDLLAAEVGRVVTVASTAGLKGYAYTAAYGAAKHGVIGLTRALAAELAATNVTVNAVCPGFTDTAIVADAVERITARTGRDAAEATAELTRFNPQVRLIETGEVAAAVLWLCLPSSRSITGAAIAVAGGETA